MKELSMAKCQTALKREMTSVILFAVSTVARHTRQSKEETGKTASSLEMLKFTTLCSGFHYNFFAKLKPTSKFPFLFLLTIVGYSSVSLQWIVSFFCLQVSFQNMNT